MSKETISRITHKVIEEMTDWASRPLDVVYAAVFIDTLGGPARLGGREHAEGMLGVSRECVGAPR